MAYEIGTATNFADLRTKMVAFLTTNPDLVALGQQWSIAWTGSDRAAEFGAEDIILSGPGLSGDDQVFVALRSNPMPASDRYNYGLRGVVGINPNGTSWDDHTNSSDPVYACFGDFEMPYWFIANGRRFIIVVRVSTVYQMMHGGLFLQYAPPNLYSYPMAIGGTTIRPDARWSDTGTWFSNFCDPGNEGNLKVLRYDNEWVNFANWGSSLRNASIRTVAPWNPGWSTTDLDAADTNANPTDYRRSFFRKQGPALGGDFLLTPATLVHYAEPSSLLGTIQGVYHVPGFNMSAETVLSKGGKDYLCIPNIYREGNDFFCAFALNEDM